MPSIIRLVLLAAAFSACGTQDSKSSQAPMTPGNQTPSPAPMASTPQPQYLPAPQVPATPTAEQTPTVADTTPDPSTTPTNDPFGVPYDPKAEVPYSPDYTYQTTSQYNPMVPAYYSEVQNYLSVIAQPFTTYATGYQLPFLYERYCQHRALLNYYPSFRRINAGHGPWDRDRHSRARDGFDRSQRWVNAELFGLIEQNLDSLRRRQYYSPRGLENRIRDAVRNRDHRLAAELHDELLREASRTRDEYDRGRNDRGGYDRNGRDGNDWGRGRDGDRGGNGRGDRDHRNDGRGDRNGRPEDNDGRGRGSNSDDDRPHRGGGRR